MPGFLGYDFYVDGFGPLIRLACSSNRRFFEASLGNVSQHGLFPGMKNIVEYVSSYLENCEMVGLEFVEPRRISDQGIFRIFGIGGDL